MAGKQRRDCMDSCSQSNLHLRLLSAPISGTIAALTGGPTIAVIKAFVDLPVRLLRVIIASVVSFSPVVGSANTSPARLGKLA